MLADNPHSVSLANFPARSFMIHQKWFEFWMDRIKSNSGEILDFDRSARWDNPSCMIMKIVKEKMGFLDNHPVYDAHMSDRHMSDRSSRWSDNRRSTSGQRNRSRPPRSRAPSSDVGRYDAGPGPRNDAGRPMPVVHESDQDWYDDRDWYGRARFDRDWSDRAWSDRDWSVPDASDWYYGKGRSQYGGGGYSPQYWPWYDDYWRSW